MEKRAAKRFPTDLAAKCHTTDRSWTTRLHNISTGGCVVTCDGADLAERAVLRIRVKGLATIDAEVIWQHMNHAGVRFRVPLHPAAMEHLGFELPEGAWASALSSVRPEPVPRPRATRASATPGLRGSLVKRIPPPAEAGG